MEEKKEVNKAAIHTYLKFLAEAKNDPEKCDIDNELFGGEWKVVKKEFSSSQSMLFESILKIDTEINVPIFLKVFEKPTDSSTSFELLEPLKYETRVYKQILDEIILTYESWNFSIFISAGCCASSRILRKHIELDSFQQFDKNGACVLATEKIGSGLRFGFPGNYPVRTLNHVVKKKGRIPVDIMFQIVYSLEVLFRHKIVHNDLHLDNILVIFLPTPIKMGFIVDKRYYILETSRIPIIYDFDFSYSEKLGNNPKMEGIDKDRFASMGMKNSLSSRRDLYTLLCLSGDQDQLVPKIYHAKERGKEYLLKSGMKDEIERIGKKIFTDVEKGDIYQLDKDLFVKSVIDGEKIAKNFDSEAWVGLFFITKIKGKHHLIFYSGFPCRMNLSVQELPTPLEILNSFDSIEPDITDLPKDVQKEASKTFISEFKSKVDFIFKMGKAT